MRTLWRRKYKTAFSGPSLLLLARSGLWKKEKWIGGGVIESGTEKTNHFSLENNSMETLTHWMLHVLQQRHFLICLDIYSLYKVDCNQWKCIFKCENQAYVDYKS